MKNYQIITDSTGTIRIVDVETDKVVVYIDLENEYVELDDRFTVSDS